MKRTRQRTPVGARLERHIERVPLAGCWLWNGAVDGCGYGRINIGGRSALAHRVSYEHHVGPIPPGLDIDHLCRNTSCVNPHHLEPVTRAVNVSRGSSPEVTRLRHASVTVCKNGHAYTEENTRRDNRGHRSCKKCRSEFKGENHGIRE